MSNDPLDGEWLEPSGTSLDHNADLDPIPDAPRAKRRIVRSVTHNAIIDSLPMQDERRCVSCKHIKSVDLFDGKATCNTCRPKKRAREAASARKKSAELKALQDQVAILTAQNKQLLAKVVDAEAAVAALQCNTCKCGGDCADTGGDVKSSSEIGHGSGSGLDGSVVVVADTQGSKSVLTCWNTFSDAEAEEVYQYADSARTHHGLVVISLFILFACVASSCMEPGRRLLPHVNSTSIAMPAADATFQYMEEVFDGTAPWACPGVWGILFLMSLYWSRFVDDHISCHSQKFMVSISIIAIPVAFASWLHLGAGAKLKTILLQGGFYGVHLGEFTQGHLFTEHLVILWSSFSLIALQLLAQFLSAVTLNFKHSVFVASALTITNCVILASGEYVDINDPIQQVSNGYGVHQGILVKATALCFCGSVALFLTWCVDRERRQSWLERCPHNSVNLCSIQSPYWSM